MTTGIYKIVSPSGKIYIGQSFNIEKRFRYYNNKNSNSPQNKLFNSFKKYEARNHLFGVIHELPPDVSQAVMDGYEIFYINQYKELGIELLNIKDGGSAGKHSDETKKKMSERRLGKKLTAEHVAKIKETKLINKKRWSHSEESKTKMSKSRIGHKVSDATRASMSDAGKKYWGKSPSRSHSDETKKILSKKRVGVKLSGTTKEKISKAVKNRWESSEYKDSVLQSMALAGTNRRLKNMIKNPWKWWILEHGQDYTINEIYDTFPYIKRNYIMSFCRKNNIDYKRKKREKFNNTLN